MAPLGVTKFRCFILSRSLAADSYLHPTPYCPTQPTSSAHTVPEARSLCRLRTAEVQTNLLIMFPKHAYAFIFAIDCFR